MENVDEQLKINIRSILCSISEDTVNGIIHALKYAGLETVSDLQFAQEEDLILVLKPIPRRKLIKAWSKQNLAVQTNLAIVAEDQQASSKKPSSSDKDLAVQKRLAIPAEDGQASSKNPSLSDKELTVQSIPTTPAEDGQASSSKNPNSSHEGTSDANNAIVLWTWDKKKSICLLQIYAKYKSQLLCPEVQEQEVWKKIALEVSKMCFITCNKIQCRNKIDLMKHEYEAVKNGNVKTGRKAKFIAAARTAFETTENSDLTVLSIPTTPAEDAQASSKSPNSSHEGFSSPKRPNVLPPPKIKWRQRDCRVLLEIFSKYKTEFSCPDECQKWKLWQKIADEFRKKNYDASSCCNKIEELRRKYEIIKSKSTINGPEYAFLKEAGKAFEINENSDNFSAEKSTSPLLPEFYCKLLQIYSKYKIEFAHPDTEEQKVWEKIARELREKFSYHCTESSCRYIFSHLKSQYENLRKDCIKSETMLYFLEKAQKAFETAENHDTPDCPVDEVNKKVGKYIPPHMRNGGYEPGKFFSIKVKNLSEDVQESDLHDLFRSFGGTIPHHICIMLDISDHSKYVAIIKFVKKEDAARAILDADGIEYNKQILKVEWAERLQTN